MTGYDLPLDTVVRFHRSPATGKPGCGVIVERTEEFYGVLFSLGQFVWVSNCHVAFRLEREDMDRRKEDEKRVRAFR